MLVLTRRVGQRIIVTLPDGRVFTIQPTKINGRPKGSVQFGIEAPDDVKVLREELTKEGGGA